MTHERHIGLALLALGCGPAIPAPPVPPGPEPAASAAPLVDPVEEDPMTVSVPEGTSVIAPPKSVGGPPSDALVSATGLASKRLRAGSGSEHPGARDRVRVHYTGWTADGTMFDSSVVRGRPANLLLERVIRGFGEGLQQMVVGEQRRFWIPEQLGYAGKKKGPQGALVFDVELLAFKPPS